MNWELTDVQAGFKKGKVPEINCQYPLDHSKKQEFHKNIYFRFIDYGKAFDCVDHNKLWKILKIWEYQIVSPAFWEICMQVKKQQLELDMEQ